MLKTNDYQRTYCHITDNTIYYITNKKINQELFRNFILKKNAKYVYNILD